MKKIFMVTALLLTLVLTACGNAGDEAPTSEPAQAEIKMGRADYGAHGKQSWASVVVAMQGDKIVGVSLDEYQFMNKNDITAGVPNSNETGEKTLSMHIKDENMVIASKRVNSEFYSKIMTEYAKSTTTITANFDAIEAFCVGKTIAELEEVAGMSNQEAMDAVSGATLVDTNNYIAAVIEAAKAAK